jgi:hypothetical protein
LWKTQERLLPLLKSLPGDVWNEGECTVSAPTKYVFSPLNHLNRKSFKRLPTTLEWAGFRKYAGWMRKLQERGALSSEVLSVLRLCAINEPLLPNLKTFELRPITGEFIPFIPLFLSLRTTAIDIGSSVYGLSKAIVASVVTAFLTLCPDLREIDPHPHQGIR